MKTNIIIAAIITALAYGLTLYLGQTTPTITSVPTGEDSQKTNKTVPAFTFTDINGKPHNITDFKGKKIILNFWASWCAPCIKEFPALITAAHNAPDDTILIALSSDLDEAAIHTFINKMKATQNSAFTAPNILIALDKDQAITGGLFQTYKLPETILIDANQTMRHKFIGANWTLEDLEKHLTEF
ncbi:MAG: TlpA family protein disulfide reductase [Alphaproteobacteria bacterium]